MLTVGDSGDNEKSEDMVSVLKEFTAQISESALCRYQQGQGSVPGNGLLQWLGGEGCRDQKQRKPCSWQAGMQDVSSTGVCQSCRENWISLCSVVSLGPRVSSSHPLMWELFSVVAFASQILCDHSEVNP